MHHIEESKLTPHQKLERRMRAMEKCVENLATKDDIPTKEEIADIVSETMREVLFKTSRSAKTIIITMAVVIGALAVIGGGLKSMLAFIGFHKI